MTKSMKSWAPQSRQYTPNAIILEATIMNGIFIKLIVKEGIPTNQCIFSKIIQL